MDKIKRGKRLAGRFVPARYGGSRRLSSGQSPALSIRLTGEGKWISWGCGPEYGPICAFD